MRHLENDCLSSPRQRVLLIDLDNCPHEILSLAETAESYHLIIASHGSQEPRVPLGAVKVLGPLFAEKKIEICQMPAGKNSADFGLTFIAGRLSAELPTDTVFEVASKDKDLDHAVRLLQQAGFQAIRVNTSTPSPAPTQAPPQDSAATMAARIAQSLCGRGAKSRPKKRQSLHAAVKARAKTAEQGMAALAKLEKAKAITYNPRGIVGYNDSLLGKFAAKAPTKKKTKTEPLPLEQLTPPAEQPSRKRKVDSSQLDLFDIDFPGSENEASDIPF